MSDNCKCGIPWISGEYCERCNKPVSPERLKSVKSDSSKSKTGDFPSVSSSEPRVLDSGRDAAERVNRYGTLFEKIGSVLQVLNTVGAVLLVIFLVVARPSGAYFFLGLLVIGLIWCLSYLQTSLIRGLASYFQMRSIDFLERRMRDGSTDSHERSLLSGE